MTVAGIEIGGTKCIGVLASDSGEIMEQVRVETGEPGPTIARLAGIVDGWRRSPGLEAVGIASFGPLDLDPSSPDFGSIVSTPKPGWSGTDVFSPFWSVGLPLGLDTDVDGAALAEGRWGAARGLESFAYVTVGTGLGVGIVNRGRTVSGRGHPEMGHVRLPRPAGDDWPGCCPYHGDCAEGLASGAAIRARHGPGEIADGWEGWATVENALAMMLHNLVVTVQPQRVLVGGGVVEGRPRLLAKVRMRLLASLAGYYTAPAIAADPSFLTAPGLGAQAGPLGAIALALEARSANRNSGSA
jgi:fructokinase